MDCPASRLLRLLRAPIGLAVDFAWFLLRCLPADTVRELGAGIGTATWLIHAKRRRIAADNIQQCLPERVRSRWEALRLAHAAFRNAGRGLLEFCRIRALHREDVEATIEIDAESYANVVAARDRGKGVIGLSAHVGNFEMIAGSLNVLEIIPCSLVARKVEVPEVDARVLANREHLGTRTIPVKNSIRDIIRTLRKGEGVGLVIDQHIPARRGSVPVPFFGRPAYTMTAVAMLQRRTGCAVLPLFMVRKGTSGRHRFVILPMIEYERIGDDDAANDIHNTARYSKVVEDVIRGAPEQWFWFHQRWREGKRKSKRKRRHRHAVAAAEKADAAEREAAATPAGPPLEPSEREAATSAS